MIVSGISIPVTPSTIFGVKPSGNYPVSNVTDPLSSSRALSDSKKKRVTLL